MDDSHINNKLSSTVADDQSSNGSTTRLEGLLETRPQVGLINDR